MLHDDLNIRGAAHDINGLMARASLSAEQLRDHQDQAVAAQAGRISHAIDQVAAICSQRLTNPATSRRLKTLSRQDVDHIMRRVADLASIECMLAERPIDFFIHTAEDVRLVTNPQQLFRILFNLVINAANAISRHGGSWVEITAVTAGGRVLFDVCDDGPGLPQDVLDYLLPDLSRGAKPREGRIGCGIVTSVHLASELGGDLKLNADLTSGTNFCLSLPERPARGAAGSGAQTIDADFAVA